MIIAQFKRITHTKKEKQREGFFRFSKIPQLEDCERLKTSDLMNYSR